ncbi:MAG: hypothetical protein NC344_03065 [Bacteroidales bacterium]|nr:hypothetical protein [Bacteroidales bacterium]MCM1146811.1 hypothetical protein [Bacteroidales bacterium]MCM1205691.1 hypothetical protein [Bacillota bacterium]MCM1510780.1 hypothetical protein [Clostridium sp.]
MKLCKKLFLGDSSPMLWTAVLLCLMLGIVLYDRSGEETSVRDAAVVQKKDNRREPLESTVRLGTVTLEDLGISESSGISSDDEPDIITAAEDEYWEIEKLDGKYYRVRREDCDADLHGRDEFDREELIGDEEDLRRYAGEHEINR